MFDEVLFCCRNNETLAWMALRMRQDRRTLDFRTAVTASRCTLPGCVFSYLECSAEVILLYGLTCCWLGVILETIQESLPVEGVMTEPMAAVAAQARPTRLSLPPKGSCWYCEKPLDSVRRFCGRTCTDAFDEEAEYTR